MAQNHPERRYWKSHKANSFLFVFLHAKLFFRYKIPRHLHLPRFFWINKTWKKDHVKNVFCLHNRYVLNIYANTDDESFGIFTGYAVLFRKKKSCWPFPTTSKMGTVKVLGERTKKKQLSFEYYLIWIIDHVRPFDAKYSGCRFSRLNPQAKNIYFSGRTF